MRVVEESSTGPTVSAIERDRSKPKLAENGSEPRRSRECWNCGQRHDIQKRELCPAYGKRCSKCRKLNHFAAKCRSGGSPSVRPVMSTEDQGESEEIFHTRAFTASLDDSQMVTLRLDSGSHIQFQVDTGAQCNVVPLGVYKKATSDTVLAQVCPSRMTITAYGGTTLPVVGTVLLRVWRGKYHCLLDCKLVDRSDIRPLLGRRACTGMKIVSYLDNDALNKPQTGGAPVYSIEQSGPLSVEQLIELYPKVFGEGVGQLEGHYHIRLDPSIPPVQHPPRRVPVPLHDVLRQTLSDLSEQGIIAPVDCPTPWISSLVIVPKKNGSLRLCLDPQDLNRAIQREHFPGAYPATGFPIRTAHAQYASHAPLERSRMRRRL